MHALPDLINCRANLGAGWRERRRACKRLSPLRGAFARYAASLLSQIIQSLDCNAAHTIEQRKMAAGGNGADRRM
jgi:hypothetical protein